MLSKPGDESQHSSQPQIDAHRPQLHIQTGPGPDLEQSEKSVAAGPPPMRLDESMCNAAFGSAETGIGWVELQVRLALEKRKSERELKQIMEHAIQSSVPLERAAALHLQANAKAAETKGLLLKQFSGCRSGEGCWREFENAAAAAALPERDAIAQLAMATLDPQLYALAHRTCKQKTDGFCQQISAAQWAQRDPANGTAWLYAASEAKAAKQNQAYEEALYKMSISTRFDNGDATIGAAIDAMAEHSESQLTRIGLVGQSWVPPVQRPDYPLVVDYCKVDSLQNPNRQQVCDHIAKTLLQSGDSLLARAVGIGIGSNLHWSSERIATLRDEQDAMLGLKLLKAAPGATIRSAAQSQCTGMMHQALNGSKDLRLGEVGSLKAQIAEQSESLSTLAQRYRDRDKVPVAVTPEASPVLK